MLNVKKKASLKSIFWLILGTGLGWEGHSLLANNGEVIKNYGISFGLNSNVFIFLYIFFILVLSYFWWIDQKNGWLLILMGGWINLIDRISWGYVRDYWWFFGVYNNLADWLIGMGSLLILGKYLWQKKYK